MAEKQDPVVPVKKPEVQPEVKPEVKAEPKVEAKPEPVKQPRDPRIEGPNELPEGFVIPAKAKRVVVDDRKQVHVDY